MLPELRAGIYRHYKGQFYQVFGYAHDSNSDSLFEQVGEYDFRRVDTTEDGGDTMRIVVVYMAIELHGAHYGPRLAVRTVEDFFARVHKGHPNFEDGTVCEGDCWNNHLVTQRFEYVSSEWSPVADA